MAKRQCILSCSTVAFDGYGLDAALRTIRDTGFDWVELAFIEGYVSEFSEELFSQRSARGVRRLLSKFHLRCSGVSGHMDLGRIDSVDRAGRRLDFCTAVGAPRFITNAASLDCEADFFRNMERIMPMAGRAGVVVCLENPGNAVPNVVNDGATAAVVADRLASPYVRINYDCGNTFSQFQTRFPAETDLAPALHRLEQLHLKDVSVAPDGHYEYPALGRGAIDFAELANTVQASDSISALCLEIPLRLRRDAKASPYRTETPLSLGRIAEIIHASREFASAHFEALLSV